MKSISSGTRHKVEFIAEMSGNHGGSLKKAHRLVEEASKAGATHFKMQTYTPDSITLDIDSDDFKVSYGHALWGGQNLYSLYQEAQTPYEWHAELFRHATELGMVPFSAPFDESAVDFLEELGCSMYKIASMEIVDLPLIRKAAETGKPLILSTGTATLSEVEEAVSTAIASGCETLSLLVCTSDYPADPSLANLARIGYLEKKFGVRVGLSDHTLGTHVAMAAIALGATLVEKHLTLDSLDGGVDSSFSASPEVFARLVREGREVASAIGNETAWGLPGEQESRKHRPSIIATHSIIVGEEFNHSTVRTLRPYIGLAPKHIDRLIGKVASREIELGQGISLEDVDWD